MPSTLTPIDNDNDLDKRFDAVKKAIRLATKEALAKSQGEQPLEFFKSAENDEASFQLGMTLFGDVAEVERGVRTKLDETESELKNLVLSNSSSGRQPDTPSSVDHDNDPVALEREAQELTRQIAFLKECSSARSYLNDATTHSDWLESAKLLAKADASLQSANAMLQTEQEQQESQRRRLEAAYSILESIRIPLRRKRIDLLGRAETAVRTCIEFSNNSIRVRSPSEAHDVIQALGAPLDAVRHVADVLNREIFQTLLENHRNEVFSGSWIFRENTTNDTAGRRSKGSVHVLEWKSRVAEKTNERGSGCMEDRQIGAWQDTLKLIQRIMSFVQEHVLLQRNNLSEIVGTRLFGKDSTSDALNLEAFGLESNLIGGDSGLVMRPMIQLMWDTCIPSNRWNPTQLTQLPSMQDKLHGVCQPFEQDMMKQHFISPESQPLLDFCSNFEQKYAEKRRAEILGQARDLLLNNDYHNTVEVGVDVNPRPRSDILPTDEGLSVFALHKSSISVTSSRLYEMCRGAMDEAVESSLEMLAPTLYRAARELLDLFRAIIPAAHGTDVQNIPRTAAIFHNDCVFLAHQCLTLGLEYKDKFPPAAEGDVRGQLLRQSCIFVDMVPPFRELADRSMGDMIDKQKLQLMEIVGSRISLLGDALQSNESLVEWTDAETALTASVNHLHHLSQAWKSILSNEVYNGSLGHLVDTVYALYLDRVLEAKAISEPACHFVSALFRNATRNMSKLVDTSRVWDRFTAIGRFMDMSLVDIESALAEGVFRSVTGPELSRLIVATFDDSDKRRRLLHALASDQQR